MSSKILRRYGTSFQSVDMDFDAKALNDVGFRRNHDVSVPVEDFDRRYVALETAELTAEAEGPVQYETKQILLDRLQAQVEGVIERLPEGGVLVIDNESGHDYPKTRQEMKNVVERGENKLHFEYSMEPALRVTSFGPVT